MNIKQCLCTIFSFTLMFSDLSYAQSSVNISQELTSLYRAARKVISDNQGHKNKPDIGDKGHSGKDGITKA